MIEFSTQCWC